jgi:hypothetical protein
MLKAQRAQEQSLKYISGRAAAALDIAACGKGVCVCVQFLLFGDCFLLGLLLLRWAVGAR